VTSDTDAIEALKYRYVRGLDTKDWQAFADCMTPDVTADYNGLTFDNRDALVDYMRQNLVEVATMHQMHHPEVEVNGDDATGSWYLHDKVFAPAFDYYLEGAGFYADRYVRTADGWKIAHTGYVRTWELTGKISDIGVVKPGGLSSIE
jgi:hypothetical protein